VLVILRAPAARVAAIVACYIGAAYWFTAEQGFEGGEGTIRSSSVAGLPNSARRCSSAQEVPRNAAVPRLR